jgi:predicted nucleic acid-binding protein
MGLILDSSVIVAAERPGQNSRDILVSVERQVGEIKIGLSVVSLIELVHGVAPAAVRRKRAADY